MSKPSRDLVAEEGFVLSADVLRVSVHARISLLTAELRDEGGQVAKVVPAVPMGSDYSFVFGLDQLPPATYALFVRSSDSDSQRLGRVTCGRYHMLSSVSGGGAVGHRKIASSRFIQAGKQVFVSLFADLGLNELYLRISDADDLDAFLMERGQLDRRQKDVAGAIESEPIRFSVISAVHNANKYLDDFFTSITSQTLDFRSRVELIMVDDGSTDRSARTIKRWQRKFPKNIHYFGKDHGGAGSARNVGIAHASHEWITFVDADDFLDPEFFGVVVDGLARHRDAQLALVCANIINYAEASEAKYDNHPLRYRFAAGEKIVPASDPGRYIQLSASSAFMRRSIIDASNLKFDERIVPNFEDANFIGRYILSAPQDSILFLPRARYFYRRRADHSSLQDGTHRHPEWYGDKLRYGVLGLLRDAESRLRRVPAHVQNTVLYDLVWQLRHVVENPEAVAFLNQSQRQQYSELLREIFTYIDVDLISGYDITDLPFFYRVGLLNAFKNASPQSQLAEVVEFDSAKGLAKVLSWTARADSSISFKIEGVETAPTYHKARRRDFLGSEFVWEHISWLPLDSAGALNAFIDGEPVAINAGGRQFGQSASIAAILSALAKATIDEDRMQPMVAQLRRTSRQPDVAERFRNAWLFMDRDAEADDSAEFLYRHVRGHRPDINAFFVLDRRSPDWQRLTGDEFRLLGFNEPEHALALLNAVHLVSSQADHYVARYLKPEFFGDMLKFKFTFLNHGIIKDDISTWLNRENISCFVTSTQGEFDSIARDRSPYKYCQKEVVLTGLPRHDALLDGPTTDGRVIVIMPTWRAQLVGLATGPGNMRSAKKEFYDSEFARRWKGVLHSERLSALAERAGCRMVFIPHPNLEQYIDFFEIPPRIELRTFGDGRSIQGLFRELTLLITDFSSKAFDVAYLEKPVAYYQFDFDFFHSGGHISRPDYFDYRRDGFGPVCQDEPELLDAIERTIGAGAIADPIYRERAAATFAFRDGRSSERVLEAILNLDRR